MFWEIDENTEQNNVNAYEVFENSQRSEEISMSTPGGIPGQIPREIHVVFPSDSFALEKI